MEEDTFLNWLQHFLTPVTKPILAQSQKKESYEVAPEHPELAGCFAPLRIDLYLFIYLFMAYFKNKTAASIIPCISKGVSYSWNNNMLKLLHFQ